MSKFKDGDKVEFEYGGKTHKGAVKGDGSWISLYSNVRTLHNGNSGDYGYPSYWNCSENDYDMRLEGTPWTKKVGIMPRASIGSDPEFFYMKGGKVLSSELVLPKDGINTHHGKITIDGVQAEINPQANTCRQLHAIRIATCIANADKLSKDGASISFDPLVPIELPVLDKLSDKAKFLMYT